MSSSGASSWSSSSGVDAGSGDSSEYPTVFLLAIFLPALAVGALFAYFHYAMRHWGELRWPWNAPGKGKTRRRVPFPQPASGAPNLVAELRSELSGLGGASGADANDSFDGSLSPSVRDSPRNARHKPLLADNIF